MFRRAAQDGRVLRFDVGGLWGGGNVVVDRERRLEGVDATAYTMWDGHALSGEGRPGSIEKFPSLSAVIGLSEHLDRYGDLGADCEVWTGDEVFGIGCQEACADLQQRCPGSDPQNCLLGCEGWPRSISDCLAAAPGCPEMEKCNDDVWRRDFAEPPQ